MDNFTELKEYIEKNIDFAKEDYKKDLENKFEFLGFPERNRKSVENFKVGDKVIFYSAKQVWTDEYDVWPYRVKSKKEYAIKEESDMVFIKDIWDNLEFIKYKNKWGS